LQFGIMRVGIVQIERSGAMAAVVRVGAVDAGVYTREADPVLVQDTQTEVGLPSRRWRSSCPAGGTFTSDVAGKTYGWKR
jgi:hypothetical protein